jgi:hypothetical protein
MPPLGTKLVDEEAVSLLERWIAEDLRPPEQQLVNTQRREVP